MKYVHDTFVINTVELYRYIRWHLDNLDIITHSIQYRCDGMISGNYNSLMWETRVCGWFILLKYTVRIHLFLTR